MHVAAPPSEVLAVRALRIVQARIGLSSTNPALLSLPRYFDRAQQAAEPVLWSFLSALHGAEDIDPRGELDARVHVVDSPDLPPSALLTPDQAVLVGHFSAWEQDVGDRRYTLWGNAGFLSKYTYATLERAHGMLSFHAVSMYHAERDELYVVVGGPGAGKTVTMLEGTLRRGMRVFATEMTHVNFTDDGPVFYKGSTFDNIRLQNLADFPEAPNLLRVPAVNAGAKDPKVCLSFTPLEAQPDRLVNPCVSLLFPRIEGERTTAISSEIKSQDDLVRQLYENASEMILRPRLYYGRLAVGGPEFPGASQRRFELCQRLLRECRITQARSILAGPRDSMAGVV